MDNPSLTGSPKQIAWAERIRANALASLPALRRAIAELPDDKLCAQHRDLITATLDDIMQVADARCWIDRRPGGPVVSGIVNWLLRAVKLQMAGVMRAQAVRTPQMAMPFHDGSTWLEAFRSIEFWMLHERDGHAYRQF